MGSELAALDNTNLPAGRLDELTETARGYLLASESEATRRSYASDWKAFTRWCITHDVESFPAVRGEFQWPSMGKTHGRQWGDPADR